MSQNESLSTVQLDRLSELTDSLINAKKDKEEQKAIINKIIDWFRENKIKTYRHGDLILRFTDERETNEFDVDLLEEKYPEIWKECHAIHIRQPHLSIKKKRVKEEPIDDSKMIDDPVEPEEA